MNLTYYTTTVSVATDDDLLDLQDVDGELQSGSGDFIFVVDQVTNVLEGENLTWNNVEDIFVVSGVGTANPQGVWGLTLAVQLEQSWVHFIGLFNKSLVLLKVVL
ncbi:hypothetical protein WICPIJ_008948 [Wickerhamomyces pijperi]|uniref:Uncharacterized protein n=1 Tax=Wickerhamomyces pijperi TaxID=599730 RepID=A0A9P8PSM1_WICPI|nr:hypothetical protein WICPIJ_008948 [Wickerhamomyces pijperi]